MKNISCVTQVSIKKVDSRLNMILKSDRSCNFYMTISKLNSMSPVFLKNFLVVFFLNAYKQILII